MQRKRYFLSLLLLAPLSLHTAYAQIAKDVSLHGTIRNKKTGESIPRASVMIIGSSRGAIANAEGKYTISLEPARNYRLRIRAIGYRDDTISVSIAERSERDIMLDEQPVTGQEVVVRGDASRIEARRIMHEVINRKKAWRDKLADFTSKAYSRWNYKTISGTDTVVRSVIESIANIYWKKGKGLAERIALRRQTANLPPELNTFSVGEIQNFYDERIDFGEYNLTSPIAEDAFDVYDYDLLQKDVPLFGGTYSVIAVETGPFAAGFVGKLWVDESDYTVGYLELEPNKAVELGVVNKLRYEQRFDDVEGIYQLPIDLHLIVGVKILPLLPEFEIEQLSVLNDYVINTGVDDPLFDERHKALAKADSLQPEKWDQERSIPLTTEEEKAYKRIDSTVALSNADTVTSTLGTILEILPSPQLPAYNQVEGLRLGVSKEITPVRTFPFSLEGELQYGFKDKRFKYRLHAEQGLIWNLRKRVAVSGGLSGDIRGEMRQTPEVTLSLGADIFDVYHERGQAYISPLTSITSLIYKEDYQEFYRGRGYSFDLNYHPFGGSTASITYTSERISDVGALHIVSDTANPQKQFNSIGAHLSTVVDFGSSDVQLALAYETTSKSFSSDYEFSVIKTELESSVRFGGFGKTTFTSRYESAASGTLPRWNLLYFETRNKFFSSSGNFRALDPFEFMGDNLWMLYAEHNFYDLPMRILGIESSEYLNFHYFVFGGLGEADLRTPMPGVHTTHDKPHAEIGIGIGNIFNVIRLEGTWRLTHKKATNFYPTLSLGFTF